MCTASSNPPRSCSGTSTRIDPAPLATYVPRLPGDRCHEDRQFAEDVEEARQELPYRAAQGTRLRHQQGQSALQGTPGLSTPILQPVIPGRCAAASPESMHTVARSA